MSECLDVLLSSVSIANMVHTQKPHKSVVRNNELLELIHSDLCEFEGILTCGGNRYIITFIDDFSKYTIVYLLKNKSDAFEKFQDFLK